jgi:hypothetical protein
LNNKQQTTRRNISSDNSKTQNFHYLYVDREVVGSQQFSSRRRLQRPKSDVISKTKTTLDTQLNDRDVPIQTHAEFEAAGVKFRAAKVVARDKFLTGCKR